MVEKTEKFKDFPCLYFSNTRLPRKEQVYLFTMLSAMFGQTPEQTVNSSVFFAHASKLLGGNEITQEEIAKQSSCFSKPYRDCKAFAKRKVFSEIRMLDECCVMCPYSANYKNAWVDTERELIAYMIKFKTDVEIGLAPHQFCSRLPISCTNDLSRLPVIPFNQYLVEYIRDDYAASLSVDSLCAYLLARDKSLEMVGERQLRAFVSLQMEQVKKFDPSDIDYIPVLSSRLSKYMYAPPEFVRIAQPPVEMKQKTQEELLSSISVLDGLLSIVNSIPVSENPVESENQSESEVQSESKMVSESESMEISESEVSSALSLSESETEAVIEVVVPSTISSDSATESASEILSVVSSDDTDLDVESETLTSVSESDLEVIESKEMEPASVESSEADEGLCVVNDISSAVDDEGCWDDEDICEDVLSETEPAPTPTVYPVISEDFRSVITNATSRTEHIASFLARVSVLPKDEEFLPVSVERVTVGGTDSLLFFVRDKYFSVMIDPATLRILKPVFATQHCRFYSSEPIYVYAALRSLKLPWVKIESVRVRFTLSKKSSVLSCLSDMYDVSDGFDVLRCAMPVYQNLVESSGLNEKVIEKYERHVKLEWALSQAADLSKILIQDTDIVTGGTAMSYQLSFPGCENLCKEGSMYVLRLANAGLSEEDEKRYWEDVAVRLSMSSSSLMDYAFLVALGNGIAYFSCFDEEIFFDALMKSARSAFRQMFKKDANFNVSRSRFVGF